MTFTGRRFDESVRSWAQGMGICDKMYTAAVQEPLEDVKSSAQERGKAVRRAPHATTGGGGGARSGDASIPESPAAHDAVVKGREAVCERLGSKQQTLMDQQTAVEKQVETMKPVAAAAQAVADEGRRVKRKTIKMAQKRADELQEELQRVSESIREAEAEGEEDEADFVEWRAGWNARWYELRQHGLLIDLEVAENYRELREAQDAMQEAKAWAHYTPMEECVRRRRQAIDKFLGDDECSAVCQDVSAADVKSFVERCGYPTHREAGGVICHTDEEWDSEHTPRSRRRMACRVVKNILLRDQGRCAGPKGDGRCTRSCTDFSALTPGSFRARKWLIFVRSTRTWSSAAGRVVGV